MRLISGISVAFLFALVGCGGGSGGAGALYDNAQTRLRAPQNADSSSYDFRADGSYSDGSSSFEQDGSLQVVLSYLGAGTSTDYQFFRRTSSFQGSGGPSNSAETIATNPAGGLYLDTDADGCFVTAAETATSGLPLIAPSDFFVSASGSASRTLNCQGNGRPYSYSFTVLGKEQVSTPLGRFDAYKMSYVERVDNPSQFSYVEETGLMWFYPALGLVKQEAAITEGPFPVYTTNVSLEISSTNIVFN